MKCAEFLDLAPGYALDALSDEEQRACAHHLAAEGPHEGCEQALARHTRVVESLASALPGTPVDPNVWRAIETRIGLGQPAPRRLGGLGHAVTYVGWATAAAALLASLYLRNEAQLAERARDKTYGELTSTAAELAQNQTAREECARQIERLEQRGVIARDAVALLEDATTKVAPMAATDKRPFRATALYNAGQKRALAISTSMQPVPGKDYELWVIAGSAPPKPAGFLRFDPSGVAVGEFDPALLRDAAPDALAISLEPAGGGPTPTDVILLAKLRG